MYRVAGGMAPCMSMGLGPPCCAQSRSSSCPCPLLLACLYQTFFTPPKVPLTFVHIYSFLFNLDTPSPQHCTRWRTNTRHKATLGPNTQTTRMQHASKRAQSHRLVSRPLAQSSLRAHCAAHAITSSKVTSMSSAATAIAAAAAAAFIRVRKFSISLRVVQ